MNWISLAILLASISTAALGQGQFVFNNLVPPDINARFLLPTDALGTSSIAGSAYTVQLLGGPAGTPFSQLAPLATTDFRTGATAGFVNPITVTVPGVSNGENADIVLKLFQGSPTAGTQLGIFGPFRITVTEAPATAPNLQLGTNPLVLCLDCPELGALPMMVAGLAGVWLTSRKRPSFCSNSQPSGPWA